MSAIAGAVSPGPGNALEICKRILAAQHYYGPDQTSVGSLGNGAFGRCLFCLLAEDTWDCQPVMGCDNSAMLVADVRIDNRDALIARLANASEARTWSDSRLLMQAYETWGIALLDHVVGDFAFAISDTRRNCVYLARDPTGQRPLHYRTTQGRLEFASMPVGLIAAMPTAPPVNPSKIADFLDNWPSPLSSTYFEDMFKVPPGHFVTFARGALTTTRYWDPQPKPLRLRSDADYLAAFHEHFEQAVKARLRDAGPVVGSQLSAGRDSSAVTAVAARLLASTGGRVLAATAGPRGGFAATPPQHKILDESEVAARTARMHPNIDHLVVRPDRSFDFEQYPEIYRFYQEPFANASNYPWLMAINARLAEAGLSVCLTGELGNLTISAGGYASLPDYLWQGEWSSWLREFRTLTAERKMRRRGALAASFGGYVPGTIWTALSRATGRAERLVRPLVRDAWQPTNPIGSLRSQPRRNTYRPRIDMILDTSVASYRKGNLARYGIDERDPTSDRRLIEFCLSLPADQLLKNGVERPLYRRAMAGLVAPEVIDGRARGLQAADWYASYSRTMLQHYVSAIAADEQVAEVIDVAALSSLVDRWPEQTIASPDEVAEFRKPMMRALSCAYFIKAANA